VRSALASVLAAALLAAGCGSSHAPARPAAPRPAATACVERLPLDTLRVPDGPRRARPLILALHGARQSGYGLQSYTGFTDDAPDFQVAYPNTPHDNGFWRPDDVPALLALVDAIGRCVPVTGVSAVGFSNGGLMANALDRCAPRPAARREVEGITHLRWHGCAAGTRVEHLRVADDTHGWPSITDANQRVVRFLRSAG
jgi:poly(3-hydroxybutyrate) depolymerase